MTNMKRLKASLGSIAGTLIMLALFLAVSGYIGHWYAVSNDCIGCKIGVGGECGIIGGCDNCDVGEVIFCWAPVCYTTTGTGSGGS